MRSGISFRGMTENPEFSGSLNYLYGLSDFWMFIFQDKDLIEKTMEAQSYQLADMYSRFLQLCSTISIFDIRSTFHSDLKLLLIDETMAIDPGESIAAKYKLPLKILTSAYLFDRPMFPKVTFEEDVHYQISGEGDVLELYKPLVMTDVNGNRLTAPFPIRKVKKTLLVDYVENTVNGYVVHYRDTIYTTTQSDKPLYVKDQAVTVEVDQFAIWASDVEIDEGALYNFFGKFARPITPSTSTDVFRDFIRGLYYLYTSGPTVELMKRGLNLTIGIPFARETEEVLDKVLDPETGNWNVITARNSYTIPYGIEFPYDPGHLLIQNTELVQIANIWDYKTPGHEEWWLEASVAIPREVIPTWPQNTPIIATPGNVVDYYMRNFLKTHTFFVRIEAVAIFNASSMAQVVDIIDRAKPSYTLPIYTWVVPLEEETVKFDDEDFLMLPTIPLGEMFFWGEMIKRNYSNYKTGTYTQSGGTITITMTAHGYHVGDYVLASFISGSAVSNTYQVTSVVNTNRFRVVSLQQMTTSGSVVISAEAQRLCGKHIHANGDLSSFLGVIVNSSYDDVLDDVTSITTTSVSDDQLIPLYNINAEDLLDKVVTLGYSVTGLPERFLIPNVAADTPAVFDIIIVKYPGVPSGIGYNCGEDLNKYSNEIHRRYVPLIANLTATETIACYKMAGDMYAVYLVRPDQSMFLTDTGFTNVYFPPTEEDPLTVTQVP